MKLLPLTAIGLILAGLGTPALADTARDARCLAVFSAAIYSAKEPGQKAEIMPFALFYLGKIQGEAPGVSIESLVRANAPQLTDEALGEAIRPCMEWMSPSISEMEDGTKFIDDAVGNKPQ